MAQDHGGWQGTPWRIAGWSAAAFALLLPLLAMQVTDEVNWGVEDFVTFGLMLAGAGGACELAVRTSGSIAYRAGAALAVAAAFLLVWATLAVGIIGTEGNPANLMYAGVLAIAITGAFTAALRAEGMARAMLATACAQALVAAIAAGFGMGLPESPPLEILGANAAFVAMWLASAWLFRLAARGRMPEGTAR